MEALNNALYGSWRPFDWTYAVISSVSLCTFNVAAIFFRVIPTYDRMPWWSSPEESNLPFPLHLSRLNKHVWRGHTPTSTLESGFHPQLVFASQRNMQESKATNGYTILTTPKVLSLYKYIITLATVPGLHMSISRPPINRDLSTPWRECRSLYLRCALKTGVLNISLTQLDHPCQQKTLPEVCLLYQIVNGHLNFSTTPVVLRNLSRSLRNASTLALESPVTCTNLCTRCWFLVHFASS